MGGSWGGWDGGYGTGAGRGVGEGGEGRVRKTQVGSGRGHSTSGDPARDAYGVECEWQCRVGPARDWGGGGPVWVSGRERAPLDDRDGTDQGRGRGRPVRGELARVLDRPSAEESRADLGSGASHREPRQQGCPGQRWPEVYIRDLPSEGLDPVLEPKPSQRKL